MVRQGYHQYFGEAFVLYSQTNKFNHQYSWKIIPDNYVETLNWLIGQCCPI